MTDLRTLSWSALRNPYRALVLRAFVRGLTTITRTRLWMPHERHEQATVGIGITLLERP